METYISQQKKQLLDSLENQARFSQLVAVVVGEKGTGKSFLIEQLHQRLVDEIAIVKIDASLAMSEDQLAKTISLQLGLNWQGSEIPLEQRIKNELQHKVLISIDDAQLLSSSCLEFILQLNQNQLQLQESVLFILLAGGSSLPSLINETTTFKQHQEMCVVFQIEPILQHETEAMVSDFCSHRDERHDKVHDDKKLDYFWQLSKGNPAELFYHLSRWLEENAEIETETKIVEIHEDEKTSYLRSFLYVLVATVLAGTLFFQDDINRWIAGNSQNDQPVDVSAKRSDREHDSEKESSTQNEVKKEVVEVTQAKSLEIESESKIKEEAISNQSELQTEKTVADNQLVEDEKIIKNNPAETHRLAENVEKPDTEKLAVESVKTADESKAENKKKTPNLSDDEISLLKQNDNLYVLQWVGLSSAQAAKEYKINHPLANKMTIYRRTNNGQMLYLVISDQYLSRMLADVAKAEYKKRGYQGKPWVKSMAAVKKEIATLRESGIR